MKSVCIVVWAGVVWCLVSSWPIESPPASDSNASNQPRSVVKQPASTRVTAKQPVTSAVAERLRFESLLIDNIPHVRQKPDFCGEACAEMYLRRLGKRIDQDAVFNHSGLKPILGRGCYTPDLAKALQQIGFRTGPVWYRVAAAKSAEQMQLQFAALHADLKAGVPSIVCMHYNNKPNTTEHFRLVVGYDARADEVIYHEPAIDNGAYQRMQRETFMQLWPLKYERKTWTVVRFRLQPGTLSNDFPATGYTNADYAQHIMQLKRRLPHKEFHIVIQPPFVVVGDDDPKLVQQRATNTVKWAVDRLKKDYFAKDPDSILDIWLFKDKPSYEKHVLQLFGERPTTPFGYYSSTHRALIMNISTGGGTLVHEIVHPFMASNFPACPSWFNEGLASLYEQSGDRKGHIYGQTNWRLAGLQQAIQNKTVPSFKTLCGTTTNQFYRKDPGTNYSQARYLCYYLQEQQLLISYFKKFRANAKHDPSGYKTLVVVLGERDMPTFRKKWEAYVLNLRF